MSIHQHLRLHRRVRRLRVGSGATGNGASTDRVRRLRARAAAHAARRAMLLPSGSRSAQSAGVLAL